jgi:ribosomal-protein-alanine N-acetyltransferase
MQNNYAYSQLKLADLDAILAIEDRVHSHPWTRGNFVDSFCSGHVAFGLRNQYNQLVGYFLLMPILDELHLLTFAVDVPFQKQGFAKLLLQHMRDYAVAQNALSLLLEVRVSNVRAQSVYAAFGFSEIGRRKAYYPVHGGEREDAVVMRLAFENEG